MINRFSSRMVKLEQSFLTDRLKDAKSYDRIAGYFRSSILEIAGEALETVSGKVRIICNSDLNIKDVQTAKNFLEKADLGDAPETFSYNEKASSEILTGNISNKKMLPVVLRIDIDGKTSIEQNQPGSEKFIFVLEGVVNVHIGERTHALKANDTLYFNATQRHYIENTGTGVAKLISVITPVEL